jgi:hypothetical protein
MIVPVISTADYSTVTATSQPFGLHCTMEAGEWYQFVSTTNCHIKQGTAALVVADSTFTTTHAADTLTDTSHGLSTGDGPVRVSSSGTLPAGLAAATDYWVIRVDANTMQLAASLADALAGTAVPLTSDGTGTHTMSDTADTARLPVASAADACLVVPAGVPVLLRGDNGSALAVIRSTADGVATLTRCQIF